MTNPILNLLRRSGPGKPARVGASRAGGMDVNADHPTGSVRSRLDHSGPLPQRSRSARLANELDVVVR